MSQPADLPVGVALALGSLTVATNLRISEPAGPGRDRMGRALDDLVTKLRTNTLPFDLISSLSGAVADNSLDDRRALLIELVAGNPFAPYWFDLTGRRADRRMVALKLVAALALGLDPDSASFVDRHWRKVSARLSRTCTTEVAGRLPAGPLIALTAAGSGRPDAAALTAGLGQLGHGSIASDGAGLTAGRWLLWTTPAGGSSVSPALGTALRGVVGTAGLAALVELEVGKLSVVARLARRLDWFAGEFDGASAAIDDLASEVAAELALAKTRNDPGSPRVAELRRLRAAVAYAAARIDGLGPDAAETRGRRSA